MSKNKHATKPVTETVEQELDQTVETPVIEHPKVELPEITREAESIYGGLSTMIKIHLTTVDEYCEVMEPGKVVSPSEGAYWTQRLYNAIMNIIEAKNINDMIDGMDGLMMKFDEHRNGVLSLPYTQRFVDEWMINDIYRDLFTHLCHIFLVFSEPVKREKQGKYMQLVGDGGMLQHVNGIYRDRLVEYLNRYTTV